MVIQKGSLLEHFPRDAELFCVQVHSVVSQRFVYLIHAYVYASVQPKLHTHLSYAIITNIVIKHYIASTFPTHLNKITWVLCLRPSETDAVEVKSLQKRTDQQLNKLRSENIFATPTNSHVHYILQQKICQQWRIQYNLSIVGPRILIILWRLWHRGWCK